MDACRALTSEHRNRWTSGRRAWVRMPGFRTEPRSKCASQIGPFSFLPPTTNQEYSPIEPFAVRETRNQRQNHEKISSVERGHLAGRLPLWSGLQLQG